MFWDCQVPTTRCRREINLLPVLGSKLKPCLCDPKQTHRPQVCHLGDGHQRSSTVDFSTFNDHRLFRCVQGAQHSLALVIHFVFVSSAVRASEQRVLVDQIPTGCAVAGWNNRLACNGANACDGSLRRIHTIPLKRSNAPLWDLFTVKTKIRKS